MRTALIVLAAGASRRFGGADKLLAPAGGMPVVRRVVEAACASRADPVIVVHSPGHDGLSDALTGMPVTFIAPLALPNSERGMSASIVAGLKAVPEACAGAAILPGDMPLMTAATIDRLICEFAGEQGVRIIVPETEAGEQRNPVVWPRSLFAELMALEGDKGGKGLLARFSAKVSRVRFANAGVFTDVDTPEALHAIETEFE